MTRRKVLIAEDELIVQLHLKQIVTGMGNDVVGTATTSEEALAAAEIDPPELVLMDIRLLGDVDGIDTARLLRDRYDCGVVFVSAYADAETVSRSAAVEASGYIVKPFTDAEVRASISTAFAGRERAPRLQPLERSLTSILTSTGEAIFVTNREGLISFVNPGAAQLTPWNIHECWGKNFEDALRCSVDVDAHGLRKARARSLGTKRPVSISTIGITLPNGVERMMGIEIETISDAGGAISGSLIVVRDHASIQDRVVDAVPSVRTRFGAGTRMLVYSHDSFGLGHLQRSLNLVRALLARNPGLSVLIVTGSSVAHCYELPQGADYVKLPAVRKVAPERYEARSLSMSDAGILDLRKNLILRTVQSYDPHVLLVDHAPIGMRGEILPALEWLQGQGTCTRILGLRDIIDESESVVRDWNERGIYDVLRDLYEHVVVYGSREIYDSIAEYQLPAGIATKTRFLDYVRNEEPLETRDAAALRSDVPLIVVSIGGGDGGSELIESFLTMLQRFDSEIDFRAEILLGPLMSSDLQRRFEDQARGLPVVLHKFVTSAAPFFRDADLVLSTGGYNTVSLLLAHARRAIVIPRIMHRQEQLIRARRMEELGVLSCIPPHEATPERLFKTIGRSLHDTDEALRRSRDDGRIPLDGAKRLAEFCSSLEVEGVPTVGRAAN